MNPSTALLASPYHAPALRKGDRAFCLFRDTDVVITSWTDARISWPRCRRLDSKGAGSGILVDEEFARAVRTESAEAIMYWWGASHGSVRLWRQALGVRRRDNPGTMRLLKAASEKGAAKLRGKPHSPEQVAQRSRVARMLNYGKNIAKYRKPGGRPLTPEELALLGTAADDVIAKRVGRTFKAVRVMRQRLRIACRKDVGATD